MTIKNLLLAILLVAVFAIGFLVGRFSSVGNTYTRNIENKNPSSMNTQKQPVLEGGTTTTATGKTSASAIGFTPDQMKMLSALGIDSSKITPTMIACAEASLGTSRLEEIKGGAPVAFMEKTKLLACYK